MKLSELLGDVLAKLGVIRQRPDIPIMPSAGLGIFDRDVAATEWAHLHRHDRPRVVIENNTHSLR